MEFFVREDFIQLKKFGGQLFDRSDPAKAQTYEHLKKTYEKVEYWAKEVLSRTFPEGVIHVIKKPTNQANKFEDYHWAKLYPSKELQQWKILSYTLTFSSREDFCVKIDTVSLGDNDPLRKKYFEYRGDFFHSPIIKLFKADDILLTDWETLINKSVETIKSLKGDYNNLLSMLGYDHKQEKVMATPTNYNTLNTILYGPPGTGKTYNSISQAVSIIESKNLQDVLQENRRDIKERYDNYIELGQIIFTTFHQSMSYEDFIEGIKPETIEEEVIYEVKDGIFKKLCIDAAFSIAQSIKSTGTLKAIGFSQLYDQFVDSLEITLSDPNASAKVPTKSGGHIQVEGISPQGNIIVKHIDGSRTYTISKQRLTLLDQNIEDLDEVSNVNTKFREIIGGSNSSAYWAVLKAIRSLKLMAPKSEKRTYTLADKVGAISTLQKQDYQKANGQPYVMVIDEINRGNIAQIFGELITLIEDDKRLGKDEALKVTLPYSKDKFGVPPNVYIIGTMNTADRSVEALDTALRRRFSFHEMPPHYNLKELNRNVLGVNLSELLQLINRRLEKLLSKDHLIGHSYFLNVNTSSDFKDVFQRKIIPLLQEYFYGDFGKIGLVLGAGFFGQVEGGENQNLFAEFNNYDANDLLEKPIYRLRNAATMTDEEFTSALQLLMGK